MKSKEHGFVSNKINYQECELKPFLDISSSNFPISSDLDFHRSDHMSMLTLDRNIVKLELVRIKLPETCVLSSLLADTVPNDGHY